MVLQTIGLAFGSRDTAEDSIQIGPRDLIEAYKTIFPALFLP